MLEAAGTAMVKSEERTKVNHSLQVSTLTAVSEAWCHYCLLIKVNNNLWKKVSSLLMPQGCQKVLN